MKKIHIGCGAKVLEGFVNVDGDSKEEIAKRYKMTLEERDKLFKGPEVFNWNILQLPVEDNSVDYILAEGFIEHLSFEEESKFWKEIRRILKVGGQIEVNAPDFDELMKTWLSAKDDFKDFWQSEAKEHWFGQGDRNMNSKWGYLTATIFGNQSSSHQFHKTCFTKGKMRAICDILNFECVSVESDARWQGYLEPMIRMVAKKK